jgi:hypothetical protein
MTIHVGDEIAVDSEKAGRPAREGTVLEVIEADWGTRYRTRWDDGHESTIHPLAGTLHIRAVEEPEESAFAEIWR